MSQNSFSANHAGGGARPWMHTLTLADAEIAAQHYMPFIKNGAVFLETEKEYEIRDPVFLLLTLGPDGKKFPVNGKVVWVAGGNSRGNRATGIGIQFSKDEAGESAKATIEEMTGKMFWSLPRTATL